jgi:hypothetical protein
MKEQGTVKLTGQGRGGLWEMIRKKIQEQL